MDKALSFMGIARKAGLLITGEDNCKEIIKEGKGRLLLVAEDASENAVDRAEHFVQDRSCLIKKLPFTKSFLQDYLGKNGCSMVCFTDIGLAAEFAGSAAQEDEGWSETAAILQSRREKATKRKAAPRKRKRV